MDKHTVAETILALEKTAMDAWHQGDPSPFLELYAEDFTYFDPAHETRLDGREKIAELYESVRGKFKTDGYDIINPIVQSAGTMAVLTYNIHTYLGEQVWKENCTEVYRLENGNEWKIIHSHFSPTKPSGA